MEVSIEECKSLFLKVNWSRWGLPMPSVYAGKVFSKARLGTGREHVVMDVFAEITLLHYHRKHPDYGWYTTVGRILETLFILPNRSGRKNTDEADEWSKMCRRYFENGRSHVRRFHSNTATSLLPRYRLVIASLYCRDSRSASRCQSATATSPTINHF